STFLYLGGAHGLMITEVLKLFLGVPGTILVILGVSVFLASLRNNSLIEKFRSMFFYRFKRKEKIAEPEDTDETEEEESEEHEEVIAKVATAAPAIAPAIAVEHKATEEIAQTHKTEITEEPEDDYTEIPPHEDFLYEEELDIPHAGKSEPKVSIERAKKVENEPSVEINAANPDENEKFDGDITGDYDPTLDLSRYKYPQADLLHRYDDGETAINEDEQNTNIKRIRETLEHYGITISSIKATVGPTITLYEIVPAPGVRISKIRNLEDDIALSLAALGIRIIAPIPGKGTVGIEVPNKDPQIVSMHSIIASKKFNESKYDLPIALGKTITNEIFMVDLCKMPHVLVAGATGQGKSVGLNAIITSLLYKKHPSQLKFVLVDPKKVEFNIYSMIEKHFLAKLPDAEEAIITDVTKVVQTLNSITREMDQRYDLLKKAHTRNIKEYNAKFVSRKLNPENGHRYMPYIVVIIDEFGDLIMTAGKEVELPIARIAQLARAVGIHMIIATQRPSTNIITGTIKANFPARVAFRVSSMIDSRTILDCPGANQLIGRGDLLFSQGGDLVRVQCAFIDTPEVEEVAECIGQQQGYPTAFLLPEYEAEPGEGMGQIDLNDRDPLFEEAARLIVANQQGSTSLLQRKMSLGYNRAGRIMDQLEACGIVGPFEGSKARQVLVMDETHLEMVLSNLR
ncbi:MAG: DNA translocase FtsK, partial [Bacteroidales bacterium]